MAYGSSGAGEDQRQLEAERQARINQGITNIDRQFAGYDDAFYDQRAKAYEDYALPTLNRDYTRTGNSLVYSLARAGLGRSTVADQKRTSLGLEFDQQRRNVADAGRGQANDLRRDVEQQRAALLQQNSVAADPGQASAQALRTSQQFDQPVSFQPIGNAFEDWTRNYLANQTARTYDPTVQPLFSWNSSGDSSRIVT